MRGEEEGKARRRGGGENLVVVAAHQVVVGIVEIEGVLVVAVAAALVHVEVVQALH